MTVDSLHEVKAASLKGLKMNTTVNATELEVIRTFEGYHLARHNGNLGIWSISKAVDWRQATSFHQVHHWFTLTTWRLTCLMMTATTY